MPEPRKFEEGDQVLVKKGARAGQRAVITEIRRSGGMRLRFTDDEVLPYGPNEVEPATMPTYSVGDLVRHQGERFRIKERCPHNASRWHLADRDDASATVRCGNERDIELMTKGTVPLESYMDRKVRVAVIVTATGSNWFGWRGTIKHDYGNGTVDVDFGSGNVGTLHRSQLQYTTPATEAKQPQPVRLVGLTGRKQAGKDTFAGRLVEQHGFTRMAFADNVRQVALAIDPYVAWKDKPLEGVRLSKIVDTVGWELAKVLPEVRRLLQRIGTEGIRSLDPEFWVRQVVDKLPDGPVVITDVRFPNEADAIKAAGGIIVRVVRTGQPKDDQHSSESAMDSYEVDFTAVNNGTVEQFRQRVDRMVADGLLRPRS